MSFRPLNIIYECGITQNILEINKIKISAILVMAFYILAIEAIVCYIWKKIEKIAIIVKLCSLFRK